jgi:hypothetical protein
MGYTKLKYRDDTKVPQVAHRCAANTVRKAKDVDQTMTHPCKDHTGHEGDHRCICGVTWKEGTK